MPVLDRTVVHNMSYSVADGLTCLYFLFLLLMVIITNVKPFLQQKYEIQTIPSSQEIDLEQPLMEGVVVNQFLVLIIGNTFVFQDL